RCRATTHHRTTPPIANGFRQGPDGTKRRSKSIQSAAPPPSIAGQYPAPPQKRRRLRYRTAGVGSERYDSHVRGHCCRGSPGGTTRNSAQIARIVYGLPGGVLIRGSHSKFVTIQFAQNNRACCFEASYGSAVIGWYVVGQNFRSRGCAHALGDHYIFNRNRNPAQHRQLLTLLG